MKQILLAYVVVSVVLVALLSVLSYGHGSGYVYVYWREWHWPTFNVADIAITLGAVCILAASLPSRRRKEPVLEQH